LLPDIIPENLISYHQSGSSVICDPPVTDTDRDFVILVKSITEERANLIEHCWKICGNEDYENPDGIFLALRKGSLNYILVNSQDQYNKWEASMLLAKHRNLVKKEDRIALFRSIRGNVDKGDF
jgi:hypothetical protein